MKSSLNLIPLFPTDTFEECIEILPNEILYPQTLYWIPACLFWYPCPEWDYHYHQLALFGQLALTQIKNTPPTTSQKLAGEYYNRALREFKDTGLPEWWGNPAIHRSHKIAVQEEDFRQAIPPKVDLPARLKRIQPLLQCPENSSPS